MKNLSNMKYIENLFGQKGWSINNFLAKINIRPNIKVIFFNRKEMHKCGLVEVLAEENNLAK